jgi:hypothetical protein
MHGTFDRPGENNHHVDRRSDIGFKALLVLAAIAMVGLVITEPNASTWIAEAAQAEFAAPSLSPEAADASVQ